MGWGSVGKAFRKVKNTIDDNEIYKPFNPHTYGFNPIKGVGALYGDLTGKNRALDQNQQNLQFQKEKYEYDKNLQQQIFTREDNATQRRAADLRLAGLSPTLAAGSAAGTGAIVQTTAPRGEPIEGPNLVDAALKVASLMSSYSSFANTMADTVRKETLTKGAAFDNIKKGISAANAVKTGDGEGGSSWVRMGYGLLSRLFGTDEHLPPVGKGSGQGLKTPIAKQAKKPITNKEQRAKEIERETESKRRQKQFKNMYHAY